MWQKKLSQFVAFPTSIHFGWQISASKDLNAIDFFLLCLLLLKYWCNILNSWPWLNSLKPLQISFKLLFCCIFRNFFSLSRLFVCVRSQRLWAELDLFVNWKAGPFHGYPPHFISPFFSPKFKFPPMVLCPRGILILHPAPPLTPPIPNFDIISRGWFNI